MPKVLLSILWDSVLTSLMSGIKETNKKDYSCVMYIHYSHKDLERILFVSLTYTSFNISLDLDAFCGDWWSYNMSSEAFSQSIFSYLVKPSFFL